MSRHGLILFAHGARDSRWAAPFEATAGALRETLPRCLVRLAFLEFMSPTLTQAVDELAAEGCATMTVVPMFLGAGGHVLRDLPRLLDELRTRHAGLDVRHTPPLGEMPEVVAAMAAALSMRLAASATPGDAA